MTLAKLAPALVALSLATGPAHAQTAPPADAKPVANPVDPASIQALKDMGAYLQTLNRFRATIQLTGERVLTDGQKLQHSASAVVEAERPDKLRALMSSARSVRELIYDGKTVTIYIPAQKYYSRADFTGPLSALVGKIEERYGVEIPLSDLFTWGTPAAPVDKIDSAMNAGQDFVGGELSNHYAFRQGSFDWQIWIAAGAKPLPRKLVITNRADEARPQSVSMIEWNLKPNFKESTFKFIPPKGSTAVELRTLEKGKGAAK